MFETIVGSALPQSWNSAAGFNWGNADNGPERPLIWPPPRLTIKGRQGWQRFMVNLGAPAVGARVFLRAEGQEAKGLDGQ
jgi:hypothetical protein